MTKNKVTVMRNNIPQEMQIMERWLVCELKGGNKYFKSLVEGQVAASDNEKSWTKFENIMDYILANPLKCLYPTFALKGSGISTVDIDAHIQSTEGITNKEEVEKIERKNDIILRNEKIYTNEFITELGGSNGTYIEKSCSGVGTHIYTGVEINKNYSYSSKDGGLEIFDNKLIVMTGDKLSENNNINTSNEVKGYIAYIQQKYFTKKEEFKNTGSLIKSIEEPIYSNEEVVKLINRDSKGSLLWHNQWEEVKDKNGAYVYGSQHFADFALIKKLIFYTGNCPSQAKELFLMSPTYRDYGQNGTKRNANGTVKYKFNKDIDNDCDKASNTCTAVYSKEYKKEKITKITETNKEEIENELDSKGFNSEKLEEVQKLEIYNNGLNKEDYEEVLKMQKLLAQQEEKATWSPNIESINTILGNSECESLSRVRSILNIYVEEFGEDLEGIEYKNGLCEKDKNTKTIAEVLEPELGDDIFFSPIRGAYVVWDSKKYKKMDIEELASYLLPKLNVLKHSAFKAIIDIMMEEPNIDNYDDEKKYNREMAIFNKRVKKEIKNYEWATSDSVVSIRRMKDVLKIYASKNIFKKDERFKKDDKWDGWDIVDYNQTPYINLLNGVLNINTMEFKKHDKKYRFDKLFGCNYDPEAECPEFQKMFERFTPDAPTRRELQKFFGLILDKNIRNKKLFSVWKGASNTGKSTEKAIIMKVLGDYSTVIDTSMITTKKIAKDNKGPELLKLQDTLFVTASELSTGDTLDSAKMKNWTGGDFLTTRNLNCNYMVDFIFKGIISIDTNYKPNLQASDDGIWNRLKYFTFEHELKKEEIDTELPARLEKEKAGIFNLMLEGLRMFKEEGFIETEKIKEDIAEYKGDIDLVGEFVNQVLFIESDEEQPLGFGGKGKKKTSFISRKDMYKAFVNYCTFYKHKSYTRNYFYTEIGSKLQAHKGNGGVRGYKNVRLAPLGQICLSKETMTTSEFEKKMQTYIDTGVTTVSGTANYDTMKTNLIHSTIEDLIVSKDYIDYVTICCENLKVPCKKDHYDKIKDSKELNTKSTNADIIRILTN